MVSAAGRSGVVIVGAGIFGASVAYHAARSGAVVTLLGAGRPGAGVTADSFAWVGASGLRLGPAAAIRATASQEYRRLQGELPSLPVTWSGSLSWGTEDSVTEAGPGQQIIDEAAVMALEPNLRHPPEHAVWAPDDGAVDPTGVTENLVAGARAAGARVVTDTTVTAVARDNDGRVVGVVAGGESVPASTVVLAAGVATRELGAQLGVDVPVEASPSPLFRFRSRSGLVRTVVHYHDFDLRQVTADRLIAAADEGPRTLEAIRSTFHDADDVQLLTSHVGARPMPADGEPIIGPVTDVPGLYLAVTHAAVTLAPVLGRLIAAEIVHGAPEPTLAGCRFDRF